MTAREAIAALNRVVEDGHPDGGRFQYLDTPLVIGGEPWTGNVNLDGVQFTVRIEAMPEGKGR